MTCLIYRGFAAAAFAAATVVALPAPSNASTISAAANGVSAPSAVVKVHSRRYKHRHDRDYERHVDAPFTHVETGRRVVVDAPFAFVHVDRHGRYVRAPFVNLWIPR
ncbi:MAG: hypothetical protein KDJ17_11735 [Hyphomicrobiaceae bacterium]|nr:hypothetical protein [Hyphomicrobiaceae bacterium]